jgi:hypothetical protein
MTRFELLSALIRQARTNGFEFRKWYTGYVRLPWTGFEPAVQSLLEHRHYYALLFSHDFAQCIWKSGADITFVVPESFFRRRSPKDGTLIEVRRKPYTRRTGRPDVWKYHLQQLALAEEPLRYMRRYIVTTEHLSPAALAQEEADDVNTDLADNMADNLKLVSMAATTLANVARQKTQKSLHKAPPKPQPISIAAAGDQKASHTRKSAIAKKTRFSL